MSERISELRFLTAEARALGLSSRESRERVIASIAAEHIRDEEGHIRQRAILKYFETPELVTGSVPVVVDAVHGRGKSAETPTAPMVRKIGNDLGSLWMVAKRSRETLADANRRTFRREERTTATKHTNTKEAPTSIRAAQYWAIETNARNKGWLDREGKLSRPMLRLALHGMTDRFYILEGVRQPVDFIIGGGSLQPGAAHVSDRVSAWFTRRLVESLYTDGAVIFDDVTQRPLIGAIEWYERDEALVFFVTKQSIEVETMWMNKRGDHNGLSGAGLGLEDFRGGAEFVESTVAGDKRSLFFDGMGPGFQTVQLEMSKTLRSNAGLVEKTTNALMGVCRDFALEFDSLEKLGLEIE